MRTCSRITTCCCILSLCSHSELFPIIREYKNGISHWNVTFISGFLELNPSDQCTLIRLGQSQSRILVAAVHWYNQAQGNFRDFLCWRTLSPDHEDEFKSRLVEYANIIIKQEIDTIEAALLNALVIVAIGEESLA